MSDGGSAIEGRRARLLTFLVIVIVIYGYGFYAGVLAPETFDASVAETAAIETVNEAREDEGMAPLRADAELRRHSTEWSATMANTSFRHGEPVCSPGGENIATREVQADSSAEIGAAIGQQWLDSPEHRANIMDSRWDHQAVGIVKQGDRVYATQQFC